MSEFLDMFTEYYLVTLILEKSYSGIDELVLNCITKII